MKKKLLLILTFCFVAACSAFTACADPSSENNTLQHDYDLEYELNADNTSYIVKKANSKDETEIIIPSTYNGLPVSEIANAAFNHCDSLKSVTIPDSVTTIGSGVFTHCSSLISIHIPDSVTSIGDGGFSYCSSLTSISVENNNSNYKSSAGNLYTKDGTTLLQYAIGKKDTTFTLPDGVNTINRWAFDTCAALESITLSDSVTYIGDNTFKSCYSLTSIIIPDSVTSIGMYAFCDCPLLTIYCEANEKPSDWDSMWNFSDHPVVWGYKGEE